MLTPDETSVPSVVPATGDKGKDKSQARPSQMSREDLTKTLKSWWRKDGPHAKKWREGDEITMGAKEAFDFCAGRQWSQDDVSALQQQRRVPITFNRVLPTIATITGIEINSRHDTIYLPLTGDTLSEDGRVKVKANEMLSQAARHFADECDAEDHQSEAFRDSVICGMGWTEARVDYDIDPTGGYIETWIDPLEMAWDYRARQKNLSDTQRRWHAKPMAYHEAREMFPDVPPEDLDCSWIEVSDDVGRSKIDDEGQTREEEVEREWDEGRDVHVLRCQWFEYEPVHIVAVPGQDEPATMTEEEFAQFQDSINAKATAAGLPVEQVKIPSVQGRRRVFFEVYVGRMVLCDPAKPQGKDEGFTFNCITGIGDRRRRHWFGLTAVMRDPQRFANSWLSQTQHILNSTAKGGILAEEGAFTDPLKAERDYAKPDSIVFMTDGAISQNKVMQKPGVGITAGHANLMQFAVSSIRDVTGINLELLGLAERDQPGVLEQQRKQAALTILAPWFDSLRRFRKYVGRLRLVYIQSYLATPGRLVRIVGKDGYELVPLLKQAVIGKHDVVISDAPTSPNQKMETWAIMRELLPIFQDKIAQNPKVAMVVLESSPLPSKVVDAFKEIMAAPPSEDEQMQKQIALQAAQTDDELKKAKIAQAQGAASNSEASAYATMAQTVMQMAGTLSQIYGQEIQKFVNAQRAAAAPQPLVPAGQEMAVEGQESPLNAPRGLPSPGSMPQLPQLPELPMQGGPTPGVASRIPTVAPNYIDGMANG